MATFTKLALQPAGTTGTGGIQGDSDQLALGSQVFG